MRRRAADRSEHEDGLRSQAAQLRGLPGDPHGVLLVHGFSGSPFEVHMLAAVLHQRGYHVEVPLLPGHNQSLAALRESRWPDWLAAADAALWALWRRVRGEGVAEPRLAVIGLSMGGLLTVELARRYPAPAGGHLDEQAGAPDGASPAAERPVIRAIAVLSSPLWLPRWQERAIRALCRVPGLRQLAVPKFAGSDVRALDLPRHRLRPPGMPLLAVRSLLELMAEVRGHVPDVKQPALLAHGVLDHTAPFACLAAFAKEIGSPPGTLHCLALPRSYHLIPLDVEREILFAALVEHLARYLGTPGA
ncbi:MAG: alpha/beta hydrolase [Polyangia bacterium]